MGSTSLMLRAAHFRLQADASRIPDDRPNDLVTTHLTKMQCELFVVLIGEVLDARA